MSVAVALLAQHRLPTVLSNMSGRRTTFETDVFLLQIRFSFFHSFVSEATTFSQWMRLVM